MSTLEDKILGEKRQYYCDSSDEEEGGCDSAKVDTVDGDEKRRQASSSEAPPLREWDGSSVNTGPKGVLKDWQRYKQLQAEKREQDEAERRALVNKLSMTCRSHLDDERDKKSQQEKDAELDKELAEILEDDFLKEYVQKRMEEMIISSKNLPQFGRVVSLESGEAFLKAVDKERKEVSIIVHLYEEEASGCAAMNGCLQCLAQEYPQVKFCKLKASVAGLTKHFKISGVPALLAYKGGVLVGNFVQLANEFGEDFFADSVESFLIENGILQDKTLIPELIRQQSHLTEDDGSSDFDVD